MKNIWQFSWSKWIIYLTIFLTPLYFSSSHWYLFTTPKALLIMGGTLTALAFFVWGLTENRQEGIKITSFHYILVLFLVIMSVTGYFGVDPQTSFFGTFFSSVSIVLLIILGLLACLISELIRRDICFIKYLLTSAFLSGIIVAFVAYLPLFGVKWQFLALSDVGGSTIGNSSFTGAFLLFVMGFGAYLALIAKSWKNRLWIILGLLMVLLCPTLFNINLWKGAVSLPAIVHSPLLLLGNAQGAILGVFVFFLISIALWLIISRKKIVSMAGIVLIIVCTVGISVGYFSLLNPQSVIHQSFVKEKSAVRFVFWDIAKQAFIEKPLLGYGFENYQTVYQQHYDPIVLKDGYKDEQGVTNPHNIIYDIGVGSGALGLLSYLLLFGLTCLILINFARRQENIERWLIIIPGILIGYFVQNLFIFDTPISFLVYFICIGLAMGCLSLMRPGKEQPILAEDPFKRRVVGWGVIIIIVASLILFVILPARESMKWQEMRNSALLDRIDMIKLVTKISLVSSINDDSRYANDVLNVVDDLRKQAGNLEQTQIMLDVVSTTISLLEQDIKYTPNHFYANYEAGMLSHLALVIDPKHDPAWLNQARNFFDEAHRISPLNPRVYFNLAQNELFRNNKKSAISFIKMGITLGAEKEGQSFLDRIKK